jgi:hypothetical protein
MPVLKKKRSLGRKHYQASEASYEDYWRESGIGSVDAPLFCGEVYIPGIGIYEEESCNGPVDVLVGLAGICGLLDTRDEVGALVGPTDTWGLLGTGGGAGTPTGPDD